MESIEKSRTMLFHITPVTNLSSILSEGLLASKGSAMEAVFLTNVMPGRSAHFVLLEIDVSGLALEEDHTGEPDRDGEVWFVTCDDILPTRIVSAHHGM